MFPGVFGVDVEQCGSGGGGAYGTSFAQHPRGANKVVASGRYILNLFIHVLINAVFELLNLFLEKLLYYPLDIGARGFGDSHHKIHIGVGALNGGGSVF